MMNKNRILGAALALLTSAPMFAGTYTFKIATPKRIQSWRFNGALLERPI